MIETAIIIIDATFLSSVWFLFFFLSPNIKIIKNGFVFFFFLVENKNWHNLVDLL